jgi:D-sedoheptulose 7-phosphate isomerase
MKVMKMNKRMEKKNFEKKIRNRFEESHKIIKKSQNLTLKINESVNMILESLRVGGKIIIFGNGGSAADAQHMSAEFIGRYLLERKSIPSIALTTDSSILTSISNDYKFDQIFSRQCEALVNQNDIIIAISTSGKSPNVIKGIKTCIKKGAKVIALTGEDGGKLKKLCEILLNIPSNETPRIQEGHRTVIHIICELVEKEI